MRPPEAVMSTGSVNPSSTSGLGSKLSVHHVSTNASLPKLYTIVKSRFSRKVMFLDTFTSSKGAYSLIIAIGKKYYFPLTAYTLDVVLHKYRLQDCLNIITIYSLNTSTAETLAETEMSVRTDAKTPILCYCHSRR